MSLETVHRRCTHYCRTVDIPNINDSFTEKQEIYSLNYYLFTRFSVSVRSEHRYFKCDLRSCLFYVPQLALPHSTVQLPTVSFRGLLF